jgi:hypothetical protein
MNPRPPRKPISLSVRDTGSLVIRAAAGLGMMMSQGCGASHSNEVTTISSAAAPKPMIKFTACCTFTTCCTFKPQQARETLSSDTYAAFVEARAPELLDCYAPRRSTQAIVVHVEGSLSAGGGTLQWTSVSAYDAPDVAACVRERVATWTFPKPSLRPPATSAIAHGVLFRVIFDTE